MFREHCGCSTSNKKPDSVQMNSISVACVAPPMPNLHGSCDCCCATEMTMINCETQDIASSSVVGNCPDGYVPIDVYMAKNDPRFEPIFGCYEYNEIAGILDSYLCFHLCGCGGRRSVLLVAAHFMQLHTEINPATLIGWVKMASKPTAVMSPLPDAMIKSKRGINHWNLTTFGMEYQEIRRAAVAVAGLAWGM